MVEDIFPEIYSLLSSCFGFLSRLVFSVICYMESLVYLTLYFFVKYDIQKCILLANLEQKTLTLAYSQRYLHFVVSKNLILFCTRNKRKQTF